MSDATTRTPFESVFESADFAQLITDEFVVERALQRDSKVTAVYRLCRLERQHTSCDKQADDDASRVLKMIACNGETSSIPPESELTVKAGRLGIGPRVLKSARMQEFDCILMECVPGQTWAENRRRSSLTLVMQRSLDAFCTLLRNGINQGDFHLGNILVDDAGHVRLVDYGLASVWDVKAGPDKTCDCMLGQVQHLLATWSYFDMTIEQQRFEYRLVCEAVDNWFSARFPDQYRKGNTHRFGHSKND